MADPPTPAVRWTIDLREAHAGSALAEAEIPRDAFSHAGRLHLLFRDATPEHGVQVTDITATVSDYGTLQVTTEPTPRGLACSLRLPEGASGLTLRYRVDPTYYPPGSTRAGPADARSRLTDHLAVLRTTALWPAGDIAGTHGEIRFLLPEKWRLAWPWAVSGDIHHLPAKALRYSEYFVAGRIEKQFLKLGGTRVHLARAPAAQAIPLDAMARLLHVYRTLMGGAPRPTGSNYLVAVVPAEFMHGGAAGRFTAVQSSDPHTLAHELFHWWNGGGDYSDDARWFAEGFTEYIALGAAVSAGLMTPAERNAALADLQEEMLFLQREGVQPLTDYARASKSDARANRMLYAKGALLAHTMAERLVERGDAVTDLVAYVLFDLRKPVDSRDIQSAARRLYGETLDPLFEGCVFGRDSLPRADFGPATGRSGAARFFPPDSGR